jgi:hypothetical protein
MKFSVECSCGQSLAVQASQAGTTTTCGCGAQVKVPSLSKLRELSGQHAYETSTIDVIQGMLGRGELPEGNHCAVSGEATDDVVELYVEAERIYTAKDNLMWAVIAALCISPILILTALIEMPRADVGRQTIVRTPLRVAAAYHAKVERSGQKALKRWLRTVPIYAKLLDQYPRARVIVGELD